MKQFESQLLNDVDTTNKMGSMETTDIGMSDMATGTRTTMTQMNYVIGNVEINTHKLTYGGDIGERSDWASSVPKRGENVYKMTGSVSIIGHVQINTNGYEEKSIKAMTTLDQHDEVQRQ